MKLESDQDLFAALLRDEDRGFDGLFDRHGAAVYRYAWSLVRDVDEARDIVQETFFIFWRRRRAIELRTDSALPWLLATCRNLAQNLQRSRRRRPTVPVDAEFFEALPTNATDEADRDELRGVLTAIGRLSAVDQQICQLCIFEGYSYAEAAHQLGLTPANVGKRVQRFRDRLRRTRDQENPL